jgi:hypothetical protein
MGYYSQEQAPASVSGTFIPAGNEFDAMAAIAKVAERATSDLLVVDPYMDAKALTDFAPLAREGVRIRLLSDQHSHKPTLAPASERWRSQYKSTRPLEVRLTVPRTLHDRILITDGADVFVLTQSLNAIASRSPASIVRADAESAALKVAAYGGIWNAATPMGL